MLFQTLLSRLDALQQIANRVQRDCVNGEDKLALARAALQSVSNTQASFQLKHSDNVFFFYTF